MDFDSGAEQTIAARDDDVPLNAIRAFVTVARGRQRHTRGHHFGDNAEFGQPLLAVLRNYLGADLIGRRGRRSDLTEFGRLFANAVSEPLETVSFTAKRMRRRAGAGTNRIVVRTSLSILLSLSLFEICRLSRLKRVALSWTSSAR